MRALFCYISLDVSSECLEEECRLFSFARMYTACSNQRDDSKSISLAITYLFMTINLKRRDGVRQSAGLPSTRTVTSWLGVWKPVDFERKYLLEKVNRSNNGLEITNLAFISFVNNLCCRRINRYSSKGKLTHNAVSRCVQMSSSRT